MAVPPGPAQPGPHRFSAGMQVCRVCRRVGAPPDVGLRPVFPLGCGRCGCCGCCGCCGSLFGGLTEIFHRPRFGLYLVVWQRFSQPPICGKFSNNKIANWGLVLGLFGLYLVVWQRFSQPPICGKFSNNKIANWGSN